MLFGLVLCLSLVAVAVGLVSLLNEQSDGGMGLCGSISVSVGGGGGGLGYLPENFFLLPIFFTHPVECSGYS